MRGNAAIRPGGTAWRGDGCAGIYINRFSDRALYITWLAHTIVGGPPNWGHTYIHTEWPSGQTGVVKQDDGIFL